MTSPPASLRWQLRHATAGAHARVDALVGDALADGDRYGGYLQGMHRFMVEAAGALRGRLALAPSVARLAADLRDLRLPGLPATPRAALPCDAAAVGWHYVIAGSSLGARLLARQARGLGFDAASGARYLHHHAAGDDWPVFLAALDARPLPVHRHAVATAAAVDAFSAVEAALHDAYALPTE